MKEVIVKNISIGDELLIGQVINTNAAWLGEHLSEAGYNLKSVLTIGDSEKPSLMHLRLAWTLIWCWLRAA